MGKNRISPDASFDGFTDRSVSDSKPELFMATPLPTLAEPKAFSNQPRKEKYKKVEPSKIKIYFRDFIKKFGMLMGTVAYCVGGAYLFNILEAQSELASCEGAQSDSLQMIEDFQLKIYNYLSFNVTFNPELYSTQTVGLNINDTEDGPEIYNRVIHDYLIELRDEILGNGYGGEDCEKVNSWQFLSGLLWTMTVVTSIGYGHTSPSTWEGQITMISYAFLGMPLFLLTCAEISVMLADLYVIFYKHVVLFPCNVYKGYQEGKDEYEDDDLIIDPSSHQAENYDDPFRDMNSKPKVQPVKVVPTLMEKEEDDDEEEGNNVRVPFVIIIGTFIGYMIGGGFLFKMLEDWDFVVGIYFTYVSLSSVGFGDYSPGTAHMSEGDKVRASRNLLFGTTFIVIGMSILGMCMSLMSDGLVENITAICVKIGIIKPDDKEEEDGDVEMIEEDSEPADGEFVEPRNIKKTIRAEFGYDSDEGQPRYREY